LAAAPGRTKIHLLAAGCRSPATTSGEDANQVKKQTGLTLIEIMVVVFIIGILAAIAIPNYSEHVTRSRIAQATSGLAERRTRMEQFFQDNHTYYQAAAGGNPAITAPACTTDNASSPFFDFSCPNPTATTPNRSAPNRTPTSPTAQPEGPRTTTRTHTTDSASDRTNRSTSL
jgi:type IV pilus assembly protein PilE